MLFKRTAADRALFLILRAEEGGETLSAELYLLYADGTHNWQTLTGLSAEEAAGEVRALVEKDAAFRFELGHSRLTGALSPCPEALRVRLAEAFQRHRIRLEPLSA